MCWLLEGYLSAARREVILFGLPLWQLLSIPLDRSNVHMRMSNSHLVPRPLNASSGPTNMMADSFASRSQPVLPRQPIGGE